MLFTVRSGLVYRTLGLALLLVFALSLTLSQAVAQTPATTITGFSEDRDWQIDVSGGTGTFTVDGVELPVELAGEGPGLNGFERQLTFLGRTETSVVILDLFLNSIGSAFLVFYYDYETNTRQFRQFDGDYSYESLDPALTLMEGYLPVGPVPDYIGQDFVIESTVASVTSQQGTVQIDETTSVTVFPVFNISSTDTLSQFFGIGIDEATGHTYMFIFFTTESGFLIDLWTGAMTTVEFGAAEVIAESIAVERDINLEDLAPPSEEN